MGATLQSVTTQAFTLFSLRQAAPCIRWPGARASELPSLRYELVRVLPLKTGPRRRPQAEAAKEKTL